MDTKKINQSILTHTGEGVRIAVLDSGIDLDYPMLRRKKGRLYDCTFKDDILSINEITFGTQHDRNGHGSSIESCLLAVAPNAIVDHYRILNENHVCSGQLLCYTLDYVVDKNYHLVLLSIGTRNEEHIPWLVSIIKRAYENHVNIVVSCSNIQASLYPARFPYCITCQAMSAEHPLALQFHDHSVTEFSGWGINVPVQKPTEQTVFLSGSSYAAAHVCGIAARVIESIGHASPLDVKTILRNYALATKSA